MLRQKRKTLILLIVFIATLLLRYNQYYTFREFNSDKARQLHGAYNLLNKKGITLESYDLNTFKPLYRYVNDWPPAYSYITAGISFLFGVDLYASSVALDFISITAFWIVMLWLTRLLKFNLLQQALLFVFLSISKTILTQFLSADLLGVTIFLYSCAVTIAYIQQFEKTNRKETIFYALQFLLFFFLIFLKFSLIPAAVAPAISIILYALVSAKKQLVKPGVILLSLFFACAVLLFIYNKHVSGDSVTYNRVMTESVLHFDNLLLFNPFIASAFFYLTPFYLRFNAAIVDQLALWITVITLLVFFVYLFKKISWKNLSFLEILLFTTLITVSGFLILVSLRFPKDDQEGYQWTFVTEYRYFAPAVVLFLLFAYQFFKLKITKSFYSTFFSVLVGISFLGTVGLEVYYLLINNKSTSFDNLYGNVFRVQDYVQKNSNDDTYFLSFTNHQPTDTEITSLVALRGGKVVVSYSNYFPSLSHDLIFSSDKLIAPGKKLIIYYGDNKELPQKINQNNKHWIEKSESGDEFLIIKN